SACPRSPSRVPTAAATGSAWPPAAPATPRCISSDPHCTAPQQRSKKPPRGVAFSWALECGASGRQALLDAGLGVLQFARQVVGQLLEQLGVQLQLLRPGGLVDGGDGGVLLAREV